MPTVARGPSHDGAALRGSRSPRPGSQAGAARLGCAGSPNEDSPVPGGQSVAVGACRAAGAHVRDGDMSMRQRPGGRCLAYPYSLSRPPGCPATYNPLGTTATGTGPAISAASFRARYALLRAWRRALRTSTGSVFQRQESHRSWLVRKVRPHSTHCRSLVPQEKHCLLLLRIGLPHFSHVRRFAEQEEQRLWWLRKVRPHPTHCRSTCQQDSHRLVFP
jgi:hypothetical protein